eukprot:scaffold79932_cov70-Phaeocystis_antarctica.AAC.2
MRASVAAGMEGEKEARALAHKLRDVGAVVETLAHSCLERRVRMVHKALVNGPFVLIAAFHVILLAEIAIDQPPHRRVDRAKRVASRHHCLCRSLEEFRQRHALGNRLTVRREHKRSFVTQRALTLGAAWTALDLAAYRIHLVVCESGFRVLVSEGVAQHSD